MSEKIQEAPIPDEMFPDRPMDILPFGCIGLIVGPSGVGKSWLTLGMALSGSLGAAPYGDGLAIWPGKIVYCTDHTPDIVRARILAIAKVLNLSHPSIKELAIQPSEDLALYFLERFPLMNICFYEDDLNSRIRFAEDGLLILDPLSPTCWDSVDDPNRFDMRRFAKMREAVNRNHCAILGVLTSTGKAVDWLREELPHCSRDFLIELSFDYRPRWTKKLPHRVDIRFLHANHAPTPTPLVLTPAPGGPLIVAEKN